MRMQTYRRKVGALEVIIHVEKELYKYVPHVFDAIFCTFEQCYYVDSPDAIHIYSQKNPYDEYKYPCFCNTRNPMWIFLMINTLEHYLYKILNCTVFHGACVKINNKNILIVGERKSGKTTLTKYLVNMYNAVYMGDDSIFTIDNVFYGFSFPILMRKIDKKIKPLSTTKDEENRKRYIYSFKNFFAQASRIDFIIFPKYDKLIEFQCDQIKDRFLFEALLNNVKESKDMRTMFNDINSLVSTAQAYCIHYNKCRNIVRFIDERSNNKTVR